MIWGNCRDVSRAVARGELEGAPWLRGLRLRLHLLACGPCRRYRRQLRLIAAAARLRAARWLAPPDFEDRLLARLYKG